jgi:hypothetical protein
VGVLAFLFLGFSLSSLPPLSFLVFSCILPLDKTTNEVTKSNFKLISLSKMGPKNSTRIYAHKQETMQVDPLLKIPT